MNKKTTHGRYDNNNTLNNNNKAKNKTMLPHNLKKRKPNSASLPHN